MEISDERTFGDAGFGKGDGRNYYSAVNLGLVDVVKGPSDIQITGKANNLNIGAVAVIPASQIEPEEPIDQPIDQGQTNNQPKKQESKGCGGSIIATASLVSMLAVGGIALIGFKRKED